ncbi:MAG: hypothetical protein KIH65_001060 [Candidatus Uhrbacteria bacterium]|nr:hypothetical protein [Candidatus Uhrbacteria bacterium]
MKNVYALIVHTDVDVEHRRFRPLHERIDKAVLHFDDEGRQCSETGISLFEKAEYQLLVEDERWKVQHIQSTHYGEVANECSEWSPRWAWIDDEPERSPTTGKDLPIRLFAKRDAAFTLQSMENLISLGDVIMRMISEKISRHEQTLIDQLEQTPER